LARVIVPEIITVSALLATTKLCSETPSVKLETKSSPLESNVELISKYHNVLTENSFRGFEPLHFAAFCESTEAVVMLLEKGADVNSAVPSSGDTALHLAARNNKVEVVRVLLQWDAVMDAQNKSDMSVMSLAVLNASVAIIDCLLENAKRQSLELPLVFPNALHEACSTSHLGVVEKLLSAGYLSAK
jgi:ankyrin repeat protein